MNLIPAPPASNGAINDANKYPEWVSSGAYAAADITFSDPGFAAATVFAAIKELYDFTQVGMAATDIQAAIKEIFNFAEVGMVSTDIQAAVKELFQFANNGKTDIAAAIVGKGGTAAAGDTFSQMAAEIGNVSTWAPNLIAANIKNGVNIFGVAGNLAESKIKSIQSGTANITGVSANLDIAITAVDTAKCLIILNGHIASGSLNYIHSKGTAELTTTTNLRLRRIVSASTSTFFSWVIIELKNNTQTGEATGFSAGVNSIDVTITAVDLSKAVLFFGERGNAVTTNFEYYVVSGYFLNTTTIRFQRNSTTSSHYPIIRWYVGEI